MPPSEPKEADAKASGPSEFVSPFVGRDLYVWNSPTTPVAIAGPVKCFDHVGSHLFVQDAAGNGAWINLNVIPSVEFRDDDPDASPASLAASLEARGSKYGPVTVERKDGPPEAG